MPDLPKAIKPEQKYKAQKKTRLYETSSGTWRRIRSAQLHAEPLCRHCMAKGLIVPGKAVDHINNDSWNNAADNLQTLCTPCHTIKTNKEDGSGWKQ
jgi:5-methylcytosine-specific restriction endonuclease McrA